MFVAKFELFRCSIKFPEPLTISFHTFHYSENYFLKLTADSGIAGWGEGAPFKLITGDDGAQVRSELHKLHLLKGLKVSSVDDIEVLVRSLQIESASLRASVDFALHDLLARAQDVPVYQLYRKHPHLVPNSVTVFIKHDEAATINETRRIVQLYPELKVLKIKLQGAEDIGRCRAIQKCVPDGIRYVLDANQGYRNPEDAVRELNTIVKMLGDVLLIEEPCPKHDLKKSKFVSDRIEGSKIFADESCCSIEDLTSIVEKGAFHGINIKLQKAGGICAARELARVAEGAGLDVMVGQMFETPLSTAASLVAAVTSNNVLLTDLDMDLDLPRFSSGKAEFMAGQRVPLEEPGFGFDLDADAIDRLVAAGLCQIEPILSS